MWTGPPRAPLYKRSVQPPHVAGDFHPPATEGGGGISSRAGWPLILAPSRVARRQAGRRTPWRTHPASVLDPATTPARRGARRCSVWRGHGVSPCSWCPVRDVFRPSPVAVEDREPHDLRCAHRQCHHNDTGTPSGPMPKPLARHMGSAIRPGWGVRVPYAWIPVAVDHLRPLAHQVIP
jgi:hypothetical protein